MPESSKDKGKFPDFIFHLSFYLFLLVIILPIASWIILYFMLTASPVPKVEWHMEKYYLQYEERIFTKSGHHLLYVVNGEKVEILPHVYGYKKEEDFVYLAAAQGYAVISRKDNTAKIVLLSEKIDQVKADKIKYIDDLSFLRDDEMKQIVNLPHHLHAYSVYDGTEGKNIIVGDGRFQCEINYGRMRTANFFVYGLYKDFDLLSTFLSNLTGCFVHSNTNKMYVTSPEGYAIVDGLSSTCRVYFTNSDLAGKDYHEDIQVLDSYEDFTPEEQGILERVEKEGLP